MLANYQKFDHDWFLKGLQNLFFVHLKGLVLNTPWWFLLMSAASQMMDSSKQHIIFRNDLTNPNFNSNYTNTTISPFCLLKPVPINFLQYDLLQAAGK